MAWMSPASARIWMPLGASIRRERVGDSSLATTTTANTTTTLSTAGKVLAGHQSSRGSSWWKWAAASWESRCDCDAVCCLDCWSDCWSDCLLMRLLVKLLVHQTVDQSVRQTVKQSDRSLSSTSRLPLGLSQSRGFPLSFISSLNLLKCKIFSTLSPPLTAVKLATHISLLLLLYLGWKRVTAGTREFFLKINGGHAITTIFFSYSLSRCGNDESDF